MNILFFLFTIIAFVTFGTLLEALVRKLYYLFFSKKNTHKNEIKNKKGKNNNNKNKHKNNNNKNNVIYVSFNKNKD